ncbi:MAG: thioredoxin [Corallococcus sp.]|nr:thioredoxin [Corallococcus sp.]
MKVIELGDDFSKFTEQGLCVVDFWAKWCTPCRMMAPVLDELAEDMANVKFGKVDVDMYSDLARAFNITSIPNLCIFKDGALVDRVIGLQSADELKETISKHL